MVIIYPGHLTEEQAADVAREALRLMESPKHIRKPRWYHNIQLNEPIVILLTLMFVGALVLVRG